MFATANMAQYRSVNSSIARADSVASVKVV